MDFALSAKAQDYQHRLTDFMTELVLPAEASYHAYREEKGPKDHTVPPVVDVLGSAHPDATVADALAAALTALSPQGRPGVADLEVALLERARLPRRTFVRFDDARVAELLGES